MLKRLANYTFDWKLSLFTLLMFCLMIKLGFWQLSREQEKISLQEMYSSRLSAPAQDLNSLDWQSDLLYVSAQLTGHFDNEHNFLLDNKINAGRPGFEVISPFISLEGILVMVNRGWLPQGQYRSDLPELPRVDGEVSIKASIYIPLGKQLMLGEDAPSQNWPRLIQSLDPEELAKELKRSDNSALFPYSVRLLENMPGVLTRNWPVISTRPEKHRGYAVQWFLMASVLLGLYIFVSTKPEN